MLPIEPETLAEMKLRFPKAVESVIYIDKVRSGEQVSPSKLREHVFDFSDGMRMIVSREDLGDGNVFYHASASGTDEYGESIRDEGVSGVAEDLMLRLAALRDTHPSTQVSSFISDSGTLHIMFEEEDDESD